MVKQQRQRRRFWPLWRASAMLAAAASMPMAVRAQGGSLLEGFDSPFVKGIFNFGGKTYGVGMVMGTPQTVVGAIAKGLLSLLGFIAVAVFVIAGIMYFTSAGDEEQARRAKSIAVYAIIGLIVALGSVVVLEAITKILKGRPEF